MDASFRNSVFAIMAMKPLRLEPSTRLRAAISGSRLNYLISVTDVQFATEH
jgi:hypothetical protein